MLRLNDVDCTPCANISDNPTDKLV